MITWPYMTKALREAQEDARLASLERARQQHAAEKQRCERRLEMLSALWQEQMHEGEVQPPWTDGAQKSWSLYLASDIGKGLKRMLLHQCNLQARWACNSEQNNVYRAGYATGFRAMTEFLLDTLSTTANTAPQDGETSQLAKDEAELRAKLSP